MQGHLKRTSGFVDADKYGTHRRQTSEPRATDQRGVKSRYQEGRSQQVLMSAVVTNLPNREIVLFRPDAASALPSAGQRER